MNHDPMYYSSQESNSVSPHLPNSQSATAVAVEYGAVHLMETLSCHIRGGNGLRAYCCRIIVRFVVHIKLEVPEKHFINHNNSCFLISSHNFLLCVASPKIMTKYKDKSNLGPSAACVLNSC